MTIRKLNDYRDVSKFDETILVSVVDLTNATTDYPLAVGQTATITYTNVTSVPLHVATVEGFYEFAVSGDRTVGMASSGVGYLNPNNATYSSQFACNTHYQQIGTTSFGYDNTTSGSSFLFVGNHATGAKATISTFTRSKSLIMDSVEETGSSAYQMRKVGVWLNTSTAWTSLGTIIFPSAQSGKVIIRRII